MEPWQLLAAVGVLLLVLEIFTPSFFTMPAGIAFLVAAIVAVFAPDLRIVLASLTVALLVVYWIFQRHVWPYVKRGRQETNASGMVGKTAVVTEAVDPASGSGYVKLYGDSWSVVSEQAFDVGAKVKIVGTDGNKVVIVPL
jgi:membrane protein implicated in regulation of membrane protease activity